MRWQNGDKSFWSLPHVRFISDIIHTQHNQFISQLPNLLSPHLFHTKLLDLCWLRQRKGKLTYASSNSTMFIWILAMPTLSWTSLHYLTVYFRRYNPALISYGTELKSIGVPCAAQRKTIARFSVEWRVKLFEHRSIAILLPIRKKIDWFLNGISHDDFDSNVMFFQYVQ